MKAFAAKIKEGLTYAFGDLLMDIAIPFIIGICIAGVITYLFPEDLTLWSKEHPFLAMLFMLVAGIPMYVCATASTPIAAALILKGLNPGAALVFLLAGPATNAAAIAVVKKIFGFRALVIYLSMIALCSLALGLSLDSIYGFLGIEAAVTIGQASELIPHGLQLVCAFILGALMIANWLKPFRKKARVPA